MNVKINTLRFAENNGKYPNSYFPEETQEKNSQVHGETVAAQQQICRDKMKLWKITCVHDTEQ